MSILVTLKASNAARWSKAKITRPADFKWAAQTAMANKDRYLDIVHRCHAQGSTAPDSAWAQIACLHYRESTMDFTKNLGQGDPLNRKTVHVPAGWGPYEGKDAFEQAAVDALCKASPRFMLANKDWSAPGILTDDEQYNGLAYAYAGAPSPYIWSGTDQYQSGKVLVDHGPIVWSVVDKQMGCAGLIMSIMALDPTVTFEGGLPPTVAPPIAPAADPIDWSHPDTELIQKALNELGASPQLKVDGIPGAATKTAVLAFQATHGLVEDGIVGANTITAIKRELQIKGLYQVSSEAPVA